MGPQPAPRFQVEMLRPRRLEGLRGLPFQALLSVFPHLWTEAAVPQLLETLFWLCGGLTQSASPYQVQS